MPTVRSIGIPVPGAPADAAGLGAIAPWMPADGGVSGQPGQAGLEPGQQHPFAAELAAAIAAKQGASTNSGSQGNMGNKSPGQNLPRQVGAQREILAKFAEKRSAMSSSSDAASAEPSATELLNAQRLDSESGASMQPSVPPAEVQSGGVALKDVTVPVDSKAVSQPIEQNSPRISPESGVHADASAVAPIAVDVVSNSSPSVAGLPVNGSINGPINPTPTPAGQSAVGQPGGVSNPAQSTTPASLPGALQSTRGAQPAVEHALKEQLNSVSSSQPQVQQSGQPLPPQSGPQGKTSTADPTSTDSTIASTITHAIRGASTSAPASSAVSGSVVFAANQVDATSSPSAVTAAEALQAATAAAPAPTSKSTPTPGAVSALAPAVSAALMNASSEAVSDSGAAGLGTDHTTVNAATVETVLTSVHAAVQSQASQAPSNQTSDTQSYGLPKSLAASQTTPLHRGQAASSQVSDADAATAALLHAASASAAGVSSGSVATVHSANPVTQSAATVNTADVDGPVIDGGRDSSLTETSTEPTANVSLARNIMAATQAGGMVSGQQSASRTAQGTDQPGALPATGVAQGADATPSMIRVTTDRAAQDQSSKPVTADAVATQTKSNTPVPSSVAAVNVALANAGAAASANTMVSSAALNTGAQPIGAPEQGATAPSVALEASNNPQGMSTSGPTVTVKAGENGALPSSISPTSTASVSKASDARAPQKVREQQDIQTAEAARSAEVTQTVQSLAIPKPSDQTATSRTIGIQNPAANLSLAAPLDGEPSDVAREVVPPATGAVPSGTPTTLSPADRSLQVREASASSQSAASMTVAVVAPKSEQAVVNVTGNDGAPLSGASSSRVSHASAAQPSTVVTPDANVTVAAPDRTSISAAEGSAAAQTLAQVSVQSKDSGESKSINSSARSQDNGLPEVEARGVSQAASSSENFQGSEGTGGDSNAQDSGRHQASVKPATDFGALVRPATDPAISSSEGARTVAQRVEAMAAAGPSQAEILARAESRVEAARASLASGPLNVEVLKLTRQGGGRAVLEVTPPNEGPIRLDLKLDGAGRATLLVDGLSEAMKSRLEGSAHFLRQDMAQMGLALNLEMRERQESNAFANAMAFSQGQGGGTGGTGRGDPTKAKSGTSVIGGGNTVSSSQSMGSGDGIHFVA